MSSSTPRVDPPGDDERLFALLDHYLESKRRSGESATAEEFIEAHPDLKPLVDCLDRLERFVPQTGLPDEVGTNEKASAAETIVGTPLPTPSANGSSLFQSLPVMFGNYELLEEIGRGGMGIVYRARHRTLDCDVAIKMIRSSRWASEDDIRRFYQEARAAANLTHPNIIRVHDVGELAGLHYLVMDLIEGKNLSEYVASSPLPPEAAAELLLPIVRAVHYLHSRGVVHRDLKPSNILVDESGTPFVTDFGLAKVFATEADQTTTGTIVGTPCYMSPEQAWGRPSEITARSDIYSLGAILYELLAGRPPFKEDNPLDVLLKVREAEPRPLAQWNRQVPRELEQICLRCLEKDPQRRYASAEELADDLERFLRDEPLTLPSLGLIRRARRWFRREPGLVARLIGLSVVAVIEQWYYSAGYGVLPEFHWPVMYVLAAWAIVSWYAQWLLNRTTIHGPAPFIWAAADGLLFTILVHLASEPRELLIVGYPLLIVASGFWIRVRLVVFMTAVCLAGYLAIYLTAADLEWPPHYPYLFAVIIALVGAFVATQVHRLRVLSRYFERRAE